MTWYFSVSIRTLRSETRIKPLPRHETYQRELLLTNTRYTPFFLCVLTNHRPPLDTTSD